MSRGLSPPVLLSPQRSPELPEDPAAIQLASSESIRGRPDNSVVQDLLLDACRNIGEPDSLYGACSALSLDERTLLTLYEHEGQWQAALSELGFVNWCYLNTVKSVKWGVNMNMHLGVMLGVMLGVVLGVLVY